MCLIHMFRFGKFLNQMSYFKQLSSFVWAWNQKNGLKLSAKTQPSGHQKIDKKSVTQEKTRLQMQIDKKF